MEVCETIEVDDGRTELRHSDGTLEKCGVTIPPSGSVVCPHGIRFVWVSVLHPPPGPEEEEVIDG